MKQNQLILSILDIFYEKIITKIDSITDNYGLLDGKMGIALFLFKYYQLKKPEKVEEEVGVIVEDVWEYVNLNYIPYFFFTGHSGIAWSLLWLGKQKFLEIDDEIVRYLESVDNYLFIQQRNKIPISIDLESGLFTNGIYLLSRCNLPDMQLYEKYSLKEKTIYMIDECERLLYRKTSSNNIYLPKLTLKLLNSILYFLIDTNKLKIYPFKTSILLKYSCTKISEVIKHSDIQDILTLKCLLSDINEDIGNIDTIITDLNKYINKHKRHALNAFDVLSESGFYSLVYSNEIIFKDAYSFIEQQNNNFLDKIIETKTLSLKDLLGIGHGLLEMLNKNAHNDNKTE